MNLRPDGLVCKGLVVAVLVFGGVNGGMSQSPRTLSYQGILSDTAGVPKANGNYGMTFRLYSAAQGGLPLWSETQVLGTRRGLFSAVLGDIAPFPDSLRFDRRYWLGIQVSPDPELTPRTQLTATGYSIHARTADTAQFARTAPGSFTADSARIAGTLPNNAITSGKIASGQVVKGLNNLHDAVTLRAQGGATITTNGDTITFNSGAGGGGTGIQGIQNTDNTLVIANPTGPTATVNARIPFSLNGNWNTEQGAFQILGDKPTIRFTGGAISGNESWIMHLGSDGPGNLGFYRRSGPAAWSNIMSLATNGNVGIGTAGPRAPLEINGKLLVTNQDAIEVVGFRPYITLTDANSGYQKSKIFGVNGDVYLEPSGGFPLTIKSISGNVGIGTLAPSAPLEVYTSSSLPGSAIMATNAGFGYGIKSVSAGVGVYGVSTVNYGVQGQSTEVPGVYGTSVNHNGVSGISANGTGVYGAANGTSGYGVYGIENQHHAFGFLGGSDATYGFSGVVGDAGDPVFGQNSRGVYGVAHSAGQYAGLFAGQVQISTDLFVIGDKHFKIDHPLDPQNRYLLHSCVESNDRIDMYNGNITTDVNGDALIELPKWFEALNKEFRYQLTVIGQFAQAIVSTEISNNRFAVKTDKPNVKVSWQVTGIRNDVYAKAHPVEVEVEKPAHERGTYTHPELYGLPPKTIDFKRAGQVDQTKQEKK